MPKGLKRCELGGTYHWFVCPCGHRWDGQSQRAKDMAWRLHNKKKCEKAVGDMTNLELKPVELEHESSLQASEAYVEKRRDVARGDER